MSRILSHPSADQGAALVAVHPLATAASAHVGVSSDDATPGGFGKLTFRVPNESDTASTTSVRIQIPEDAAMASLSVKPVPGWKATTETTDLDEPLEAHGQEISSYVSVVEFRADDGGGIAPGEFQEFSLSGGPFPDAESLSYPTVQTYSDGSESAWIEPTVDGQEPENPAPTLSLTGDAAAGHDEGATTDTTASDESNGTAVTALVLAIIGLLAGLAGIALGWTARRRTVSS